MGRGILSASALALLAAAAGAAGCTPTREYHGFVSDAARGEAMQIQVGVDTKTTIQQRYGSPSTVGALSEPTWYYVSSTDQRFAYYQPRTVERSITAIRFGENDIVAAVDHFGLDRGRVVSYNDNKTPTRGRELGIIEQIFGNVGRGAMLPRSQEEQNEDTRRGR